MLFKNKNILVLAAHPDDETLGCGATIKKLSELENNIHLVTFTNGLGARNIVGNRNNKIPDVANFLGIGKYNHANFPDNEMDTVSLLKVVQYINSTVDYVPDVIFTHHNDCLNIDHHIVYRATLTAFRPQFGDKTQIYSYYVPSSTDYNPLNNFDGNVYFDVVGYEDYKIQCLKKYYSKEMREYPHTRSIQNIENLMKVWGSEIGIKYAEKFQLIRNVF